LPAGYNLSLIGAALFGIAGVIDMIWHLKFGIEVNLAALISPPHLLLMLAGTLIVAGPLRAAWRRPVGKAPWTAVISASLLLSMLTFFNQFDEPLVDTYAATTSAAPLTIAHLQQLGILGIMVQTALLTGVVLYLLSRFTLPFGSITLLVGLNGALLGSLEQNFDLIPGGRASGRCVPRPGRCVGSVPALPGAYPRGWLADHAVARLDCRFRCHWRVTQLSHRPSTATGRGPGRLSRPYAPSR